MLQEEFEKIAADVKQLKSRPSDQEHDTVNTRKFFTEKWKEEFEKIAADVKQLKSRPSDQELLDLYGLYKQAIAGDINIDAPGISDMKGKAKWDAWNSRKGMSTDDAMTAYITLAKETINKYGM